MHSETDFNKFNSQMNNNMLVMKFPNNTYQYLCDSATIRWLLDQQFRHNIIDNQTALQIDGIIIDNFLKKI